MHLTASAVSSRRIVGARGKSVKCSRVNAQVQKSIDRDSRKVSTFLSTGTGRKESSGFRFSIMVLALDMVGGVAAIDFPKLTKVFAEGAAIYSCNGESFPMLSCMY